MQGKDTPEASASTPVYVGIDVCKAWLDAHLHPLGKGVRVANDRDGLRRLKRLLAPHPVALVVLEATGKLHRGAQRSLHAAGLAVAVVDPLRARQFAQAIGMLAKTDRIDARLLALQGAALAPTARPPAPAALTALQELVAARAAAVAERTALANRHGASEVAFLRAELARRIAAVETHIARLEAEIARRIAAEPALARRRAILTSIPGVGELTAQALLAGQDELGRCTAKAAASLAGLAPIARDSGAAKGPRRIQGGRAPVRAALCMAAVAAARCHPDLAAFYRRLRDAGKPAKLALTTVMRKLVVLANTLLRQDRTFQPQAPIHA